MLYISLVTAMWPLGRSGDIKGFVFDSWGRAKDLTGHTITVMIEQSGSVAEVTGSIDHDVRVVERVCPAPSDDYPNNGRIFGDAAFDFDAVLIPGNYIHFRRNTGLEVWSRRIQFVNPHHATLHLEVPEPIDATWRWSASEEMPRQAERGIFYFEPNVAAMSVGPYQAQLKLEDADGGTLYSAKINGYVTHTLNT